MSPRLAIGVLTHNRVPLLVDTLESLFAYNPDLQNVVLVDNGSDGNVQNENRAVAKRFGLRYVLNVQTSADVDTNKKIEVGVRRLIQEVLDEDSDICCLLQDDWRCLDCIPVDAAWEFLCTHQNIGQLRLRDFKYDDSFDGGSSINFVTHLKIHFSERIVVGDASFDVGELHWVDSCNLMRRAVLETIATPFSSEIDRMRVFHQLHPSNAQLRPGIFRHTGPCRIRPELREKGLFAHADIP